MKKLFLLTFVLLLCFGAFAQELIAHQNEKGMYVVHTVAPKETFYSLGRLYNVAPKDIAAFNGLEMERGLNIGQTVQVPLNSANFTQESEKGHPVYYIVGNSEGLYRVSVNNNKVQMANLRKWNNLPSDNISAGQKLIVGFLVAPGWNAGTTGRNIPVPDREYARMPEEKVEQEKEKAKKEEPKPVQKTGTVSEKKPEQPKITVAPVNDGSGGYFKKDFDMQVKVQPLTKEELVTSGIFKTASGWQDAKYYALIDGIEPGTIIRVVNPNNNKAIYAKVLDKMTGIRQNQGYNLRISNAAATALEITDTEKFFVKVQY